MSNSSSFSCGSSRTSGSDRFPDFTMNGGDDGLSVFELWYVDSIDEVELGYRKWPRDEKVGVTGEDGISDADEF